VEGMASSRTEPLIVMSCKRERCVVSLSGACDC
jgi:hypothetical protein